MDSKIAIAKLKKLPISKSWQNNFVGKAKNIINPATGKPEPRELDLFVYSPASAIIQAFTTDKEFLSFRLEHKTSKDYEYNLIADKTENNNRRLAIMYISQFLKEIDIEFLIDDAYTLYITADELQKLTTSDDASKKEFYNSLYVPKIFGGRKGTEETWSN